MSCHLVDNGDSDLERSVRRLISTTEKQKTRHIQLFCARKESGLGANADLLGKFLMDVCWNASARTAECEWALHT